MQEEDNVTSGCTTSKDGVKEAHKDIRQVLETIQPTFNMDIVLDWLIYLILSRHSTLPERLILLVCVLLNTIP